MKQKQKKKVHPAVSQYYRDLQKKSRKALNDKIISQKTKVAINNKQINGTN